MNAQNKSIFAFSEIQTDYYKQNMSRIMQSLNNLKSFTDNLENKVDGLLKAQENQFVISYKQHMVKIKQEFNMLEKQLQIKQAQIDEYESTGKYAEFIKRINFLEGQERKHLNSLERKQQEIRDLTLERSILKNENKRLEERIKKLLTEKSKIQDSYFEKRTQIKFQKNFEKKNPTFSTQLSPQSISKGKSSKFNTEQRIDQSIGRKSERSQNFLNPEKSNLQLARLLKEISSLKKQNRELLYYNTKKTDDCWTMESFFIETVNEIKKNIATRKQAKECSLEDFRKQDKIELLIKILSNDDILVHLHEKIFQKKNNKKANFDASSASASNQRQETIKQLKLEPKKEKIRQLRSLKKVFPNLNSTRFF